MLTKTITFFSSCLLFWHFLFSGCSKNSSNTNSDLPLLTFEGKNIIGCMINNEPWVPKGTFSGGIAIYPTAGGYYVDPFFPNVHILLKTNNPNGEIELFCRNYSGSRYILPGRYHFNKKTQSITGYFEIHSYGLYYINGKEYITDSLHTGWIDILKSDSINKIVSGKFEFTCFNSSDNKSYIITDGRFDFNTH